jgi:hypothetical protein
MKEFIAELDPGRVGRHTIRKTRFGEIIQGMRLGGAYAFDAEAYGRFFPLAREISLPVTEADFEAARDRGDRFLTVELFR